MLSVFLKTALLNIWHGKTFSIITIVGLTLGIGVCILMMAYVNYEWNYDAFHQKKDRIYRVVTYVQTPSEDHYFGSAAALGPAISKAFPQVQLMTRITSDRMSVQRPGHELQQDNFLIADSTFFQVFTFPLVKGNPAEALVNPFSIVLSQKAALKYFGKEDPVGQALIFNKEFNLTVTGVMEDVPEQSHFAGDMVLSMSTLTKLMPDRDSTQWNSFGTSTYIVLDEHADAKQVSAQLPSFIYKYAGNVMKEAGVKFTLSLEPLTSIYLHSKYGSERSGNAMNVYVTLIAALLIMLMAVFNFINLATSMASKRAKEISIRKIAGSSRRTLVIHFLFESLMYCCFSFVLACGLVMLLIPFMNDIAGKTILTGIFEQKTIVLWAAAAALTAGIIAGIYPALVMSSFQPLAVLNNRWFGNRAALTGKRVLLFFNL